MLVFLYTIDERTTAAEIPAEKISYQCEITIQLTLQIGDWRLVLQTGVHYCNFISVCQQPTTE